MNQIKSWLTIACFMLVAAIMKAQQNVIPLPGEMTVSNEWFELNTQTALLYSGECESEAGYFGAWLAGATANNFKPSPFDGQQTKNFIWFHCSGSGASTENIDLSFVPIESARDARLPKDESYKLFIKPNSIIVQASTPAGIFYASQTLIQLLSGKMQESRLLLPSQIQNVAIDDKPQFAHRGLLLDCCRHFMSVEFVKQTIDLISQYKMNVLHWHLTEDQGWRIQIDKYPLLTEVGAWRTEADGSRYGGYYTKQQIRDIVAYAAERHVTIIPEIELPGHSVAAIAAYPQLSCTGERLEVENEWGVFKDIYCAGNEYTFEFLQNVLAEVCELFPAQYIHIGGDEAPKYRWENCPRCQNRMATLGLKDEYELQTYFIERIATFLATKNKKIIGWDEILEGGIPADAAVQSWRGMQGGMEAARAGHYVVMSPTSHCYFDYPLNSTDLAEVYSFRPIPDSLNERERAYIMGAECNMWTERSPQETVHSKIFPRLIALSEVLWTPTSKLNYENFKTRLSANYACLDVQDVDYGFESVPYHIDVDFASNHSLLLWMKASNEQTSLTYQWVKDDKKTREEVKPDTIHKGQVLQIESPATLYVNATWRGKQYREEMVRQFNPHKAMNKSITLGYTLSPYYPASGTQALADGALGSLNFRDGQWQGVSGQNMEVVIDLEKPTEIHSIASNWYHYGNAWIYRPAKVEYYVSDDGVNWQLMKTALPSVDEKAEGQSIEHMTATFEMQIVRYIKMISYNYGLLPKWHDAVGEPSWLFCDEIIVE
ncbi:MAG: family 20 glycosylhydrolase [Flavobacteriales bacterium]